MTRFHSFLWLSKIILIMTKHLYLLIYIILFPLFLSPWQPPFHSLSVKLAFIVGCGGGVFSIQYLCLASKWCISVADPSSKASILTFNKRGQEILYPIRNKMLKYIGKHKYKWDSLVLKTSSYFNNKKCTFSKMQE